MSCEQMQVVYPTEFDPASMVYSLSDTTRRTGGAIDFQSNFRRIELSIFVDHSLVEVFTGTGDALATR